MGFGEIALNENVKSCKAHQVEQHGAYLGSAQPQSKPTCGVSIRINTIVSSSHLSTSSSKLPNKAPHYPSL